MKIIWSPTARIKAKEILEYIAEDNPDAALTLIDQLEEKVEKLKENPDIIEILTIRHFRQNFISSKL